MTSDPTETVGQRLRQALIGLLLGLAILLVLYATLRYFPVPGASFAGELLLGADPRDKAIWPFPFTIQALMWIVFVFGLLELQRRHRSTNREGELLDINLLPEDERTILVAEDLGPLYSRMRNELTEMGDTFLFRLVQRIVFQFQSSRSIDQANTLLNSSLELFNHEVDLRYGLVRYLAWLLPTLGFMGTVVGIALALAFAGQADFQDPNLLGEVSARLAVAFNTTLLALLLSAVLVFLQHLIQTHEERVLNRIGQYCLDNLINRLYVSED